MVMTKKGVAAKRAEIKNKTVIVLLIVLVVIAVVTVSWIIISSDNAPHADIERTGAELSVNVLPQQNTSSSGIGNSPP